MDYSVCSILEQKISRICYNTVEVLKVALTRVWHEIMAVDCAAIVGNFCKSLRKYIEAKGGKFGPDLFVLFYAVYLLHIWLLKAVLYF